MSKTNGKKISKELAGEEISDFLNMMEIVRPHIVNSLKRDIAEGVIKNKASTTNPVTYFQKEVNAFVFDKDLVTRFFDDKAPDGSTQKPADVLLVFLGTVKQDEEEPGNIGTPTVILAGCYAQQNGTFRSMNLPGQEATEFPPKTFIQIFPKEIDKENLKETEHSAEHLEMMRAAHTKQGPLVFKEVKEQSHS